MEGISACLSSGTASAYLYALYGESDYLPKAAHAANLGTAGFLLSTAGLPSATVLAGAAGDGVRFASSVLTALGIGWRFGLCGGLLLLGALGYMLSSRKITG